MSIIEIQICDTSNNYNENIHNVENWKENERDG